MLLEELVILLACSTPVAWGIAELSVALTLLLRELKDRLMKHHGMESKRQGEESRTDRGQWVSYWIWMIKDVVGLSGSRVEGRALL